MRVKLSLLALADSRHRRVGPAPLARVCQNFEVDFFSLAQPFTAGKATTRHRSPIHRASLSLELKH